MVDHYIKFPDINDTENTFQFQTSVAEGLITVTFLWNMSDERWYFKVLNSKSGVLAYRPLIGSPMLSDINLFRNISTSKCIYREKNKTFEITV